MRRTRSILLPFLALALAQACSESVPNGPVSTLAPDSPPPAASADKPPLAPKPAEPEETAGECAADSDCTTTALPPTPIRSEADCCFPICRKRVASREEVDALQPLYGASCKAVLCAPQTCAKGQDPVPVCRQGRCVAGP